MDINRKNMQGLFSGFNLLFQRGLGVAAIEYPRFCAEVNSSTSLEEYPWLEPLGGMREWIGDREIENLASNKMPIYNRDFEKTVAVDRNSIEDDKYGIYSLRFEELGQAAGNLWSDLAIELLEGAADAKWVDGKSFFATDRKTGTGKNQTLLNNRGTAEFSADAYTNGRKQMQKYRNSKGQIIGIKPTLLVVGSDYEKVALEVLKTDLIIQSNAQGGAASARNVWQGSCELMVLPHLDKQWFLFDISRPIKPVLMQKRKMPNLITLDNETDANVFFKKQFVYGSDARGAAAWAMPHLALGNFPV